jgi:hypothetical protein
MADKIIKTKELFRRMKSLRTLHRLLNLNDQFKAKVRDNPLPYLDKASEEILRHRRVIEDIRNALRPTVSFVVHGESPIEIESIESIIYKRLSKVERIIEDFDRQIN